MAINVISNLNGGSGNWSDDNTWVALGTSYTNAGTGASISSSVLTPSPSPTGWVANALVNHKIKISGQWYIISANSTTTATLTGYSAGNTTGTTTWVLGGVPLNADSPTIAGSTTPAFTNQGSGATVTFTATASGLLNAITTAPVAVGSGYPINTNIFLRVTGGGGTGGIIQASTTTTGTINSFSATCAYPGSGYTGTTGATTAVFADTVTYDYNVQMLPMLAITPLAASPPAFVTSGIGTLSGTTFTPLTAPGWAGSNALSSYYFGLYTGQQSGIVWYANSANTTTAATLTSPPAVGSGCTITLTTVGGVITGAALNVAGTTYGTSGNPVYLNLTTGGTGGIVSCSVSNTGVITGVIAIIAGGTGYSNGSSATAVAFNWVLGGTLAATTIDGNLIWSNNTVSGTGGSIAGGGGTGSPSNINIPATLTPTSLGSGTGDPITSNGVLTPAVSPSWVAGTLIGQQIQISSVWYTIISNTSTTATIVG